MTHVFDGEPDARQSDDPAMPTSRFRPKYRALTGDEKQLHDEIKAAAQMLEALFKRVEVRRQINGREPQPREAALAMTKLEEAVMWAVKGLTA
jgi:hypothetical protein